MIYTPQKKPKQNGLTVGFPGTFIRSMSRLSWMPGKQQQQQQNIKMRGANEYAKARRKNSPVSNKVIAEQSPLP